MLNVVAVSSVRLSRRWVESSGRPRRLVRSFRYMTKLRVQTNLLALMPVLKPREQVRRVAALL